MITLSMIAERLENTRLTYTPTRRQPSFKHLANIDSIAQPFDESSSPDVLYFGNLAQAIPFAKEHPSSWVLCTYTPNDSPERSNSKNSNLILCLTEEDSLHVFGYLSDLFSTVTDWVMEMKASLLQGGSYQNLLDISENILNNFIAISDSEFRLIAYTQHVPIDDPFSERLVEMGFHEEEIVERFKRHNVMREWESQTKVEIKSPGITPYPVIDYVFHARGNYFLHVVMQCNNSKPTPGLRDYFQLLIDHIDYCVSQNQNDQFYLANEPSRLFGDLAARRPLSKTELTRRLASAGIKQEGPFQLLVMAFTGDSEEMQFISYHASRAKRIFRDCHVGIYNTYVLVLDPTATLLTDRISQLRAFVNMLSCVVGASEPIERIEDFASAFQQARNAASLAANEYPSIAQHLIGAADIPIYRFGDCFASYVAHVATTNNHLVSYTARNGIVAKLAHFDAEHDTFDTKILFSFLRHERNVRKTCDELFIHRSTLLYRIRKMQERFNFNLDDPKTRERIIMEYFVLPADVTLPSHE